MPAVESGRHGTAFNLHVLRLAMAHRAAWLEAGVDLPLSVNVTPGVPVGPGVHGRGRAAVRQRSPEGEIWLEVTEQATVDRGLAIDRSADRLREQGFEFLLDDFGAEYSSLTRLAELPFSTLKIDGSLVEGMMRTRAHRSIVHAAISLAHTLGLKAVAERVESVSTWKLLQALGCDQLQGYLVAEPMPAERLPGVPGRLRARPAERAAPPRGPPPRRSPRRERPPDARPPRAGSRAANGSRVQARKP